MKPPGPYKMFFILACMISMIVFSCNKFDREYSNPDDEWRSGGQQTVFDQSSKAFGHVFPVLPEHLERVHDIGDVQFSATFVSAPAPVNPGLGPIFNNVGCASCHIGDGRGKVPGAGETSVLMLFRINLPGSGAFGEPLPVPGFGDQLQNRG